MLHFRSLSSGCSLFLSCFSQRSVMPHHLLLSCMRILTHASGFDGILCSRRVWTDDTFLRSDSQWSRTSLASTRSEHGVPLRCVLQGTSTSASISVQSFLCPFYIRCGARSMSDTTRLEGAGVRARGATMGSSIQSSLSAPKMNEKVSLLSWLLKAPSAVFNTVHMSMSVLGSTSSLHCVHTPRLCRMPWGLCLTLALEMPRVLHTSEL